MLIAILVLKVIVSVILFPAIAVCVYLLAVIAQVCHERTLKKSTDAEIVEEQERRLQTIKNKGETK